LFLPEYTEYKKAASLSIWGVYDPTRRVSWPKSDCQPFVWEFLT